MSQPTRPMPARPSPRNAAPLPTRMVDNHGAGALPPTIAELSDLVIQLRDIMAEENEALDRYDYDGLPRLTEQKRIIAGLLREKQQVVKRHPEVLTNATTAERDAFEELLNDMQKVGKVNELKVRTARDANKILLDAIIRGATKQSQLGTGYGRNGGMTNLTANYAARQPVSLFSNERC
ncbi:MAG TPA: hypothetical protein VKZ87_02280 [Ferrovibrio sp.]|uniref:hypothetical protein n=1 Tax=Ferrovibrio sp. TaxID=1917215 RepID=UPI002B4AE380|nr:hypothetical protein [Ferrovibrio sp.]HLT76190.1 hypothetical protein [Ferrovibrio sp.]